MSGHVLNPEYSWIGASLDGVVHDPGCCDPNELLEIKSPYHYRDSTFFKQHPREGFCQLEKGKPVLGEQNHYFYLVQGHIAICSRKWYDFVFFTNAGISILQIFF